MINVKKGPAHSLRQTDFTGTFSPSAGIVAGMVVTKTNDGEIVKASPTTPQTLMGFAIHNQTDSSVRGAGIIGAYALDGASILETDQTSTTITFVNYPRGSAVYAEGNGSGKIVPFGAATGTAAGNKIDRIVGWVEDIRDLPNNNVGETGWSPVTVLAIKLNS